jgi:hypothetical protein
VSSCIHRYRTRKGYELFLKSHIWFWVISFFPSFLSYSILFLSPPHFCSPSSSVLVFFRLIICLIDWYSYNSWRKLLSRGNGLRKYFVCQNILTYYSRTVEGCGCRSQCARSNGGIVASNPAQGMDVYVRLSCVCVVLCVGSGLAMGWSPVQGVLPTLYMIKKLKKRPRSNKNTVEP